MDELLSALRYKSEGTDIDFKSTQYRFIGANDDDKSEMLKDILAIANAWRDGAGYILLGFKDQRPHPALVMGINASIDDAKLQQFVNGKVKPKLTFKYDEVLYEGKTVGIITIPKQNRPFYLATPYGKLKRNVVYVRRGSSTDEAEPPEIAAMAMADTKRADVRLDLSVLTVSNEDLPDTFPLNYLQFPERLPDYESPRQDTGPFGMSGIVPSMWQDNRHFRRECAEYARVHSALIEMQFVLMNRSEVQLSNAKLEVSAEPLDGQIVQILAGADLPRLPTNQRSLIYDTPSLPQLLARPERRLVIDEGGRTPVCHVRFGSLLPGEEGRSSDTLAIVPFGPGRLRLRFRVLAGELPEPYESERVVEATGDIRQVDVGGLDEMYQNFRLEQRRRSIDHRAGTTHKA